ncbi:MAG: mobile mystery protein A [Chitinophagaceae bacterium]|nr:MAG: mobile mystery protein A [Chitinophagaceae bacterium]
MRNQNKLQLAQLHSKLMPLSTQASFSVPEKGWIFTLRSILNITLEQLSNKLNLTKQGVKKIEEREVNTSVSLKTLIEVGDALDLKLVYAYIPKEGSFEDLVANRAYKIAEKIVLRTHQNMQLENQGNSAKKIKHAIKELAEELQREMPKALWD